MRETVLIKSGDLYFSRSEEGCNSTLPIGKKIWLNDQIIDMYKQIEAMAGTVGTDGKDGRGVEMKIGVWPIGAPDTPENQCLQWRWMARSGEGEFEWLKLVSVDDLKGADGEEGPTGPQGPEGPRGPTGVGITIKGSVVHAKELCTLKDVELGDGYMETSTGFLWRCNNGFVWDDLIHWDNLGKIVGPTGARGPKGDRGKTGPKGSKGEDGGGISSFIIQWIVNSATSAAISGAMTEVSSMVNDAINDAINQMMSEMEAMVTDAVEKAVSDALEDIKGEKGDKGDKGDDGEPGKTFELKGRFDSVDLFRAAFPPSEDTLSFAAMIGPDDGSELNLWAVVKTTSFPGLPDTYQTKNFGKLKGPKGEDATWEVSIRDKDFVETKSITVESDLPSGVAGMYIQETDSIVIEGLSGSQADPKQVGFRMAMKYPIPKLVKEGDPGVTTTGKVLGNDGEKLTWVEGGSGSSSGDEILLKGADNNVWSIRISDDGRLYQELSVHNTDKTVLQISSPSGAKWGITINNAGRLNVSGVL